MQKLVRYWDTHCAKAELRQFGKMIVSDRNQNTNLKIMEHWWHLMEIIWIWTVYKSNSCPNLICFLETWQKVCQSLSIVYYIIQRYLNLQITRRFNFFLSWAASQTVSYKRNVVAANWISSSSMEVYYKTKEKQITHCVFWSNRINLMRASC